MSRILKQELDDLQQRVATLAGLVQTALGSAVSTLIDADRDAAHFVCDEDQVINRLRFALESDVVTIIATQQPVAGDVRLLVGVLEIASELERMGDYAKDVARIAIEQSSHGAPELPDQVARMAEHACAMLEQATTAFLDGDAQLATEVARDDDAIDECCDIVHRGLIERVRSGETSIDDSLRLLPVVHNIERFADRVTNICERIVYVATGEQVEFDADITK